MCIPIPLFWNFQKTSKVFFFFRLFPFPEYQNPDTVGGAT